jgi:hypothetical protein
MRKVLVGVLIVVILGLMAVGVANTLTALLSGGPQAGLAAIVFLLVLINIPAHG